MIEVLDLDLRVQGELEGVIGLPWGGVEGGWGVSPRSNGTGLATAGELEGVTGLAVAGGDRLTGGGGREGGRSD